MTAGALNGQAEHGRADDLHVPFEYGIPVGRQFEQILNARYLQRLGYGRMAEDIDAASVHAFLEAVPDCERALASYRQDGNHLLLAEIDHQLDKAASGIV